MNAEACDNYKGTHMGTQKLVTRAVVVAGQRRA